MGLPIDVDDLVPVSPGKLVDYKSVTGPKAMALIRALHPDSAGDDHEVSDGRGRIIAICETAELASLVTEAVNERYERWLKTR